jgi:ABC-type bacteriocin/lantibiotic exporter with double-glycine peptidase domain
MKHQRLTHWCGPAAVANALECLGIQQDQEAIATVCHVTRNGTEETEIIRALLHFGAKCSPLDTQKRRDAKTWLTTQLSSFGPAILCVDNWDHYVTVIGHVGTDTVWLFDPAAGVGLARYRWVELMRRWRLSERRGGPRYSGVGVSL